MRRLQRGLGVLVLFYLAVGLLLWASLGYASCEITKESCYNRFPDGIAIGTAGKKGCLNWDQTLGCFFVDVDCDYRYEPPTDSDLCGDGGGGGGATCPNPDIEIGDTPLVVNFDVWDGDATMFEGDQSPTGEGNIRSTTWERDQGIPMSVLGPVVCGSDYCASEPQVSLAPTPEGENAPVRVESGQLMVGRCSPLGSNNSTPIATDDLGCGTEANGMFFGDFINRPADVSSGELPFLEPIVIRGTSSGDNTGASSGDDAGEGTDISIIAGDGGRTMFSNGTGENGGSLTLRSGNAVNQGATDTASWFAGQAGEISIQAGDCDYWDPNTTSESPCAADVVLAGSRLIGTNPTAAPGAVSIESYYRLSEEFNTESGDFESPSERRTIHVGEQSAQDDDTPTSYTIDPCGALPPYMGETILLDCFDPDGCTVAFAETEIGCNIGGLVFTVENVGEYPVVMVDTETQDVEGSMIVLGQTDAATFRQGLVLDTSVDDNGTFEGSKWIQRSGSHAQTPRYRGGMDQNITGSVSPGIGFEDEVNLQIIPDSGGGGAAPFCLNPALFATGQEIWRLRCDDADGCTHDDMQCTDFPNHLWRYVSRITIIPVAGSNTITITDNGTLGGGVATLSLAGNASLGPDDTLTLQMTNNNGTVGVHSTLHLVEIARSNN